MADAMKMTDMAQKPEKNEKLSGASIGAPAINPYSYAHRVTLNSADLNKLGMSVVPKVGDKVLMHAEGEIHQVSSDQTNTDGKARHNVTVQLKKMGIQPSLGGGGSVADAVNQGIKQGSQQND
jgi:hypothetical protein